MPFQIIRNDITKVKADAIVNTANPKPVCGAGTDEAIYKAAGKEKLLAKRKEIGEIARGEVAVTPAFKLKAKYIIHTVGPSWKGGKSGEFDILRNCYRNALTKAAELGCESIAFPLIATGVYGFPKADALQIAMNEIGSFLMREDTEMVVKLVVFDDKAFRLSRSLFFQVESFIGDEEVLKVHEKEYGSGRRNARYEKEQRGGAGEAYLPVHPGSGQPFDEDSFDKNLYMKDKHEDTAFHDHLLQLMIEKDYSNTFVYKSANITKGAFSKIMCGDTKVPQKRAVLGLCIGMKLTLEEAEALLASADMAFNPYNKRDKLVIKCLTEGQYDIHKVNAMLYVCHQPELGNLTKG